MSSPEALKSRQAWLRTKKARFEDSLAAVKLELDEIDIALKVLERLSGTTSRPPWLDDGGNAEAVVANRTHQPREWRPPTIPHMIYVTLDDEPLLTREILSRIRLRFAPDVDPNSVRSQVWRLFNQGKLRREGRKYCHLEGHSSASYRRS